MAKSLQASKISITTKPVIISAVIIFMITYSVFNYLPTSLANAIGSNLNALA